MSEYNLQLCRFCQRNVKLTYYCESCGTSCCSDCLNDEKFDYYVCQDCESKKIANINGKRKCIDCNSDNVIKITQHLKSCPKCHSNQIINIYEKNEELEQRFLELIKETRIFVKPFRAVINKLYILRQKIKQARDPPIRCFHYPRMEYELLSLFKAMSYVKNNLLEKINIHFQHLALNKEYFFDIHSQPNSNIRIIENILENLNRSCNAINEYIDKNLNELNAGIEKLQDNLKFIEKINEIFLAYKRFLNIAEKEKPVYAIRCKLQNGLNSQDTFKKNKGLLFITNFDLSFVHEYGRLKKKQEKIFKAPVKDLIKVHGKGTLFKKLYIEFPYGKYEFSLASESLQRVIDYILLARTFDETVIYDEVSARKLFEIDLDINDIINFIEDGIISFFNMKCQYNKRGYHKPREFDASHTNYIPQKQRSYNNEQQYQSKLDLINSNQNFGWKQKNSHYTREQPLNFHPQDQFRTNRFQNYSPQKPKYTEFGDNLNPDEKLILVKQLKRAQKYNQVPPPSYNIPLKPKPGNYNSEHQIKNSFNRLNNKHLSSFFNSARAGAHPYYTWNESALDNLIQLKQERFGLKETLKNLEAKFDQGIINDTDYFRTYKNLQKDLYLIESKIENISQSLEEENLIKRNFDQKGFYT
ncbi:MAG: B-box zinc finger protein [Promethearchaeota archaeon]